MYENLDEVELLHASLDAMSGERSADAVSLLKELVERNPSNFQGHYLLAAEYMQLGMIDRAEASFRQAMALAPDFPMARFQLGQLYLVQGDAEEAGRILAPLLETAPGAALGFYARGLLSMVAGDERAAKEALRNGLACEQEIPALAGDMQRLLADIVTRNGEGELAVDEEVAAGVAPLYLSAYGRTES